MQRRNRTDGAPENAPIIAIVGRPNVGKSTLFNAIYGERRAIVEDLPGVTRDRNYGFVNRFEIPFHIVDTGGYEANATEEIQRHTVAQTVVAIEEADAIIALFDANTGVHPTDEEVVQLLRAHGKPTYFVVNKCDGKEQNVKSFEFYQLGVPEVVSISALEGLGVRDLTQRVLSELPNYRSLVEAHEQWLREREAAEELSAAAASAIPVPDEDVDEATELLEIERAQEEEEESHPIIEDFAPVFVPGESGLSEEQYDREFRLLAKRSKRQYVFADHEQAARAALAEEFVEDPASAIPVPVKFEQLRVAIVGRPNVGKSTLLNQLVGESRAITSPIAGTTRDAIDAEIEHEGMRYILVDTAGVRKQSRIDEGVERYSTLRSLRAIVQADVVITMVDALEGPTEQDVKLASLAHEHGKGLIIAINKWDAVEKDHRSAKQMTDRAEEAFKFAGYAPISFISAISGRRCAKLLDTALEIANQRLRRIPTGQLNQLLQRAHRRSSAPSYRGIPLRLYFGSQIDVAPITVVLFLNQIRNLHFSYLRFLQNEIREEFKLTMTDVKLIPRKRQ